MSWGAIGIAGLVLGLAGCAGDTGAAGGAAGTGNAVDAVMAAEVDAAMPGSGSGVDDAAIALAASTVAAARGLEPAPDTGVADAGAGVGDSGARPLPMPDLGLADGPGLLSQTGLYADIARGTLAEGVEVYTPRHALWSDGADKVRYVKLPEGAVIDSADPDYWVLPVGTKLWKDFSVDGRRIETRLVEKVEEGLWFMMAYLWNDRGTEAVAVPFGQTDAAGTAHDVPGQNVCQGCHEGLPDRVLGFSAVQLASDGAGLTLRALWEAGRLSDAPAERLLEGTPDALGWNALGYLHANCGHCHNPTTGVFETAAMDLWLRAGELGDDVTATRAYATTVGVAARDTNSEHALRVRPGAPEDSELMRRVRSRVVLVQMPPIGSEVVDGDGVGLLGEWIGGIEVP